jgi:hypothetical protein
MSHRIGLELGLDMETRDAFSCDMTLDKGLCQHIPPQKLVVPAREQPPAGMLLDCASEYPKPSHLNEHSDKRPSLLDGWDVQLVGIGKSHSQLPLRAGCDSPCGDSP